jgi:hypothetical protein
MYDTGFHACAPFCPASGGFQRVFPPLDPFPTGAALDRAPSRLATTFGVLGTARFLDLDSPGYLLPRHASATTVLPPVMVERKES